MEDTFKRERETFQKHKRELVADGAGKYVLIRNDEILGVYESELDAIADGYRRLGNVPFYVKRIEEIETPVTFVSNIS